MGQLYKISDLIRITHKHKDRGVDKEIISHCKPLSVEYHENSEYIKNYEVLEVFEVQEYLNGNNPTSSKIQKFTRDTAPEEVKVYFELYGQRSN